MANSRIAEHLINSDTDLAVWRRELMALSFVELNEYRNFKLAVESAITQAGFDCRDVQVAMYRQMTMRHIMEYKPKGKTTAQFAISLAHHFVSSRGMGLGWSLWDTLIRMHNALCEICDERKHE